jgi:hypothetical protein
VKQKRSRTTFCQDVNNCTFLLDDKSSLNFIVYSFQNLSLNKK